MNLSNPLAELHPQYNIPPLTSAPVVALATVASPLSSLPRYGRCPLCGEQTYLHRGRYLCRDAATCGYVYPAIPRRRTTRAAAAA